MMTKNLDILLWVAALFNFMTGCGKLGEEDSSIKAIIGIDGRETDADAPVGVIYRQDEDKNLVPVCTAFAIDAFDVMTAGHCLEVGNVYITMFGSSRISVKRFEKFERADIARVQLEAPAPDKYILSLNSSELISSEPVYELFGFDPSTHEIFRSKHGQLMPASVQDGSTMPGVYFHDLDTRSGSSGSPILEDGKVVAIHVATNLVARVPTEEPMNIAVSVNNIETIDVLGLYSQNVKIEGAVDELKGAYEAVKASFPEVLKKVEEAISKLTPDKLKSLAAGLSVPARWGYFVGEAFDRIPVHGEKYDQVQNPLAGNQDRRRITYKGFRLGNNNFENSPCSDRLAATANLTATSAHIFVKFSNIQPGAKVPKPIKYELRLNGLCGLQDPGKIRVFQRTGSATYKIEAETAIPTDWQGQGYGRYNFTTYSDQIAIEFTAGVIPEDGEIDDFLVESVEVEVADGLEVQAESAKICKTELFLAPNYGAKCWGQDNDFANGWWLDRRDGGAESGQYLCGRSDEIKSMKNSCSLTTTVCDTNDVCAYSANGEFSDITALGLKKINKFRVSADYRDVLSKFGVTKCSQLANGCPSNAGLIDDKLTGSKQISDPVTRAEAHAMLVIAGLASAFKDQHGQYPNQSEMDRMIKSLEMGLVDVGSLVRGDVSTPFSRQQDQLAVYFQFRTSAYCRVQNEDQMAAYGGFGRVSVVAGLNVIGTFTGDCGWPVGFYRKNSEPSVYKIFGAFGAESIGTQYCHVKDDAQMIRFGGQGIVRIVDPGSDLGRGSAFIGDCSG